MATELYEWDEKLSWEKLQRWYGIKFLMKMDRKHPVTGARGICRGLHVYKYYFLVKTSRILPFFAQKSVFTLFDL